MWYQFILENIHFAVNIFTSISFFMVFWLYMDGWSVSKKMFDLLKFFGFLMVSVSFLFDGMVLEKQFIVNSIIPHILFVNIVEILRISGYLSIILGISFDPIQSRPKLEKMFVVFPFFVMVEFLNPLLSAIISFFYYKKSTIGLEKHLKKVSLAFFVLTFSELFQMFLLFENSDNLLVYKLTSSFGLVWIIALFLQLAAGLILLHWSFDYLFKRFFTQMFVIFNLVVVCIFLIITLTFTAVLTKNIKDETLSRLSTDSKVIAYAIDSKKMEALADAQIVASNNEVINSIKDGNRKTLQHFLSDMQSTKNLNSILVTDTESIVLARGEDKDNFSDSLSSDEVLHRALGGEKIDSMTSNESTFAPQVSIKVATPIKDNGKIIGAVLIKNQLDNNFLDGIKKSTGLEASVYGGNVLSATTIDLLNADNRPIGITENSNDVASRVLREGAEYSGSINILNMSFYTSILPIRDKDTNIIGMLSVGVPQSGVLSEAGKSIELTFVSSILLLVFSILPSYLISKYIDYQLN